MALQGEVLQIDALSDVNQKRWCIRTAQQCQSAQISKIQIIEEERRRFKEIKVLKTELLQPGKLHC
jgi:hypothetical protein